MKKQYAPYNLAFLQPVDPVALGIPQYRDIIRHPMDLATMKKKLDNGSYRDEVDFERDMRLMFNNCYTFNAPGSEVYNLGKELEAVFERKWEEKPLPGAEYSGSIGYNHDEKPRRSSAPAHSYEDADDESTDDDGTLL